FTIMSVLPTPSELPPGSADGSINKLRVVGSLPSLAGSDAALVAWGLTFDLVIVVPSLYYFLVVRAGAPAISVVPVTLLSLAAAGALIPRDHHQAVDALELAVIPLEVGLVGFLLWQVRRMALAARGASDVPAELSALTRKLLGPGRASEMIASEAAVFYFALAAWGRRAPEARPGELPVTHDRRALYSTFFWGIMIAGGAELVGVHFLVMRWSDAAAWVLSALSLYGLAWLVGDYRAVRLQRSTVGDGVFSFRLGLRWAAEIPLASIERVRSLTPSERASIRTDKETLTAVLLGEPNMLLELREPVAFRGPYGIRRRVDRVALTIDEPAAFETAVAR
ncbi:MAG: hypothetical protein AAGF23_26225, partial [Acidobacteriota bacterium]